VFDKTKRREFYFPISKVYQRHGNTVEVKINFGTHDGIGLGAYGKVVGVKNEDIKGHNNIWLGNCEVTDIAESQAILKIFNMLDWKDSSNMVLKNDMVKLPIMYPTRFTDLLTECTIMCFTTPMAIIFMITANGIYTAMLAIIGKRQIKKGNFVH
jgi:hypothetical protein